MYWIHMWTVYIAHTGTLVYLLETPNKSIDHIIKTLGRVQDREYLSEKRIAIFCKHLRSNNKYIFLEIIPNEIKWLTLMTERSNHVFQLH